MNDAMPQAADFVHMLSFLDYSEFEALRNCCWFLHNLTRTYRTKWQVWPMRPEQCCFAVFAFIKRARFESGVSLLSMSSKKSSSDPEGMLRFSKIKFTAII
jgi:hypothetical protein